MIKFGMKLPEIYNELVRVYQKVRGQKPTGLDLIKIKQEAMLKFQDMRKILDMQGKPIDPSQPIMGGSQQGNALKSGIMKATGAGPKKVLSEDEIRKKLMDQNKKNLESMKSKLDDPEDMYASGGRAGFKDGLTPSDYLKVKDMLNHYHKYKKSGKPRISKADFARAFFRENNADGGRIGYAMGSEGIMQMASVDDPFYRGGEEDEHSFRMFNKPYKELNADELEEFREEMMRLMNKFASAPDPMDERNMVMENIAMQEFGKPLKDLNEDEIIQIEIMIDEMTEKPNRGAQSIKLADGGRAAFKDGEGMFKTLFYNKAAPILSGFNTSELFDLVTNLSSSIPFADGGRAAYKDGPKDPRRRGFMKAAVGIASMLPFGIGKGVKMAKPAIEKSVELAAPALNKIIETVMTLGKTISQSGRRVKEMVTKKKHKDIEVEEDIMDGSYIIKKDNKEIYYKPGRRDEMGIEDDIIEVIDKTVKKASGGVARMLGE